MKKPVVDYKAFRLKRINEPEYNHIWLLAGWIVYFILYFITENLIPESRLHLIHCGLDDIIRFNEYFLILYCYWYVYLIGSLLYFFLYDIKSFKHLQIYIIFTQLIAMLVYILYPSIQNGRPDTFERDNILTRLMAFIYAFDTPTGVFPSLHVAYSIAIASVTCHAGSVSKLWETLCVLSAVLISISTAFVKQHSVLDIAGAIPMCALIECCLYSNIRLRPFILLRDYLNS